MSRVLTEGAAGYSFEEAAVVYAFRVTIPTASVLVLNGTPIELVVAPGAGKILEAINGFARIVTYGGTPYATNLNW